MDGGVRFAKGTHEGDAATGEANGRGTAGKVMEPARVRIRMDEGNELADPPGGELHNELCGKSRHAIPAIGDLFGAWVSLD